MFKMVLGTAADRGKTNQISIWIFFNVANVYKITYQIIELMFKVNCDTSGVHSVMMNQLSLTV